MRLPRRWPLFLIAAIFVAGCLYVAWRIHAADQRIEDAYAKIQRGINWREADRVLQDANLGWDRLDMDETSWEFRATYRYKSGHEINVFASWDSERDAHAVKRKEIKRPTWQERRRYLLGW